MLYLTMSESAWKNYSYSADNRMFTVIQKLAKNIVITIAI